MWDEFDDLKMNEGGDTSQGNQGSTWRWERQEMDCFLGHQLGIQACQHLDFAPWDPSLTYDLQNGKIINLRSFKAISFSGSLLQ